VVARKSTSYKPLPVEADATVPITTSFVTLCVSVTENSPDCVVLCLFPDKSRAWIVNTETMPAVPLVSPDTVDAAALITPVCVRVCVCVCVCVCNAVRVIIIYHARL